MESIGIRDFLNYRYLSNVTYAPDGKRAAFVVSNCNEDENSYESRLWLYDGDFKQLTDLGREARYIWEDEHTILFPAVRSAKEKKRAEKKEQFTSLYRLDLRGGEALPAFTLPFAASSIRKLPNGSYAVLGTIDANAPEYYRMNEEDRGKVEKGYADDVDYEVFDELPYWSNGGGVVNKSRTALFFVSENAKDVKRVTEPFFSVDSLDVIGETVYFVGDSYTARHDITHPKLFVMDGATGTVRLIREYAGLFVDRIKAVGENLLMMASEGKDMGLNENSDFYLVDRETGELTMLYENTESLWNSVGSDVRYGGGESMIGANDRLYYITTRRESSHLYALDPSGNNLPVATEIGSIDAVAIHPDNDEALMIALYEGSLQELYAKNLRTGALRKLSHFNDGAFRDKYVAKCEPVSVESCGLKIEGWVLKPKDYDPEKKYPAVFDVHGGPKTVYGTVFYHEMQVWAGMGYFVFFCNPKGSDGRGDAFADIMGHYGETDYQNLMDFADEVLRRYPAIDPNRVCETGGSYGGFMTNWIIGHTDRFCACASQRSISNWLSFNGISDIGYYFVGDQNKADFYTDYEKLWDHSPLKYAKNVKTPTLFIHSDEDYRCPLDQGLQMYASLVDRGVPARICVFHGENHELSRSGKPLHRIRRLTEITNWFEKYAK
jgi:dipeptidyl aminopeptidase/acylaminoacyl peptidase